MSAFFFQLKLFTKRLLWALLFLEASRLYFFIRNFNHFESLKFSEILISFFHGIQFDYYSFFVFGSIFFIFGFIPCKCFFNKKYQTLSKIFFVFGIAIILLINFIDSEYFRFTGKRSTFDLFTMIGTGDDTLNMLPNFIHDFWYSVIIFFAFIWLVIRFYPKIPKGKPTYPEIRFFPTIIYNFLTFILLFFLARGFGMYPTTMANAIEKNPTAIPLTLNSCFSIIQTIGQENLKPINYFSTKKAQQYYSPIHQYQSQIPFSRKNVVVLILESFGKEYVGFYNHGKGYTPFLDSLLQHCLTFRYSLANGKKSVEGIPAVVASIPNLQDNPFIFSPFISNRFTSLASILGNEGYQTAFFHGGKNGTMGFDLFAKAAGFQAYYGKNEYPDQKDYDGNWGIYDEPYLQYIAKKLNSFRQPFFISEFTLSSHHPYKVPPQYKGKFPKGSLPIHRVVAYSDYALKQFFETAQKQPWYKNTLFVLVADHTSLSEKSAYQNALGTFEITMAYFAPDDSSLQKQENTVTQQIDIMPSILDYLHYSKPFFSFGESVFSRTNHRYAVTYLNGLYEMTTSNRFLLFDKNTIKGIYQLPEDSLLQKNLFSPDTKYPALDTLKAFLQIYSHSLVNNKMLP